MDKAYLNHCFEQKGLTEPLSASLEKDLLIQYQNGDAAARRRLIESNLRFVIKVAMKYRNQGMSLSDLVQEGVLGLIEALEKFDTAKDCRLITYASWWIRLYIQRALEQKSRPVNLPINKLDMLKKVKAFEQSYWMANGRKPTNAETAAEFGMDESKIDDLNDFIPVFNSIHGEEDERAGLEKVLVDERYPDAREVVWLQEARHRLHHAMDVLNHREREVLDIRYGLKEGGKKLSLRKVGIKMGLSAEGVRRIEEQAMSKLRRPAVQNRMATLLAS